jgi:hypothetical protein
LTPRSPPTTSPAYRSCSSRWSRPAPPEPKPRSRSARGPARSSPPLQNSVADSRRLGA